ncbi:GDSL-type esterase/lipase family protein [Hymenobacter bucti]|uniref:GDSL-type esterase/lipase family protein n=1 Tax=Hymenobacter bucti TaxID=1844114 RepID=A0ABW4QZ38_9BACT
MQWYEEEIQRLEQLPSARAAQPKVVFYGSSTFTRWPNLAQDFPQLPAVNLGFGGSTLAACAWFFERVVPRQQPAALVVYAGDNDLGDGRTPEEVVLFFEQLLAVSKAHLGIIPLCFISIKPSPARHYLREHIQYANACIQQRIAALGPPYYFLDLYPAMLDGQGKPQPTLYEADGLHLSPAGYARWRQAIGWQLSQMGLLPA